MGPLLEQLPLVGLWLHLLGLGDGDVGQGHVELLHVKQLLDGAAPDLALSFRAYML